MNWDDLRVFLAVARTEKFTAAGQRLGLDHSTVSRRINALEETTRSRLFDRSPRGLVLTVQGQALVAYAERMEAEASSANQILTDAGVALSGSIRLATPEAFGCFLLASKMAELAARHPQLQLQLIPHSRAVSLSKREADLAVTPMRPPKGRLIAHKLSNYRVGLYASRSYLDRHPPLTSLDDLRQHAFVWYIDDLLDFAEYRYLDQVIEDARIVFRSSSLTAQQNAVASGLGLGLLHGFAAAQDSRLVRVLEDKVSITRQYWISYPLEDRASPRLRAVITFLKGIVEALDSDRETDGGG